MYFKSASVLRSIPMSAWLLPEHAEIDRIWWNAEVSASASSLCGERANAKCMIHDLNLIFKPCER